MKRTPRIVGILLFFFAVIGLSSKAQVTNAALNGVTVSIDVAKQQIISYEPLFVSVTISNQSGDRVSIPGNWQSIIRIQVRATNETSWREIQKWWQPAISQPPTPPLSLNPQESQSVNLMLYTFNSGYDLLVESGRAYAIRACFQCAKPFVDTASEPALISVLDTPTSEQSAFNELKTNKNLIRFLAPIQHGGDVSATGPEVSSYIQRFPDSCYSQYLRFSFLINSNAPSFSIDQKLFTEYQAALNTNYSWLNKYLLK